MTLFKKTSPAGSSTWVCTDGTVFPQLFYIVQGPILNSVFCVDSSGLPVVPEHGVCPTSIIDPGFLAGNIGGFAQAADDTREVIEFTHDRPLPLGYETAVPLCDVPDTDVIYDVSISEESGLQVPKRMVADAEEGREIIVTVANAGPDVAPGHVTVVGVDADGVQVFDESVDLRRSLPTGPRASTWLFSLDYATTVSWTATAVRRVRPEHGQQHRHRDDQGDDKGAGGGGGGRAAGHNRPSRS